MGGKTIHAPRLMHGKTDRIKIVDKSSRVFSGFVGDTAEVGRYHSLVTDKDCLPECMKVTAVSGDGGGYGNGTQGVSAVWNAVSS